MEAHYIPDQARDIGSKVLTLISETFLTLFKLDKGPESYHAMPAEFSWRVYLMFIKNSRYIVYTVLIFFIATPD